MKDFHFSHATSNYCLFIIIILCILAKNVCMLQSTVVPSYFSWHLAFLNVLEKKQNLWSSKSGIVPHIYKVEAVLTYGNLSMVNPPLFTQSKQRDENFLYIWIQQLRYFNHQCCCFFLLTLAGTSYTVRGALKWFKGRENPTSRCLSVFFSFLVHMNCRFRPTSTGLIYRFT